MSALGTHAIASVVNVPVAEAVCTVPQVLADTAVVLSASVPVAMVLVRLEKAIPASWMFLPLPDATLTASPAVVFPVN